MPKASPGDATASLFTVPNRYLRSVQLERDFDDPHALDDYIVTPAMAAAFQRIAAGNNLDSRARAWRITGDYGVGKSAFAVALAHILSNPKGRAGALAEQLGWRPEAAHTRMWPILVTGARETLARAIGRGIRESLVRQRPGRSKKAWASLIAKAEEVERNQDNAAALRLVDDACDLARASECGLLLIIDELGKLLEYAANEGSDVYLLQQIAQHAQRSGGYPFQIVGLLHQGFQAYAERLPSSIRHEWDKVAGRYEEIIFDQPMAHTAALVAGALGVRTEQLAKPILEAAHVTAAATASTGWMSGATSALATLETTRLYPIHPAVLPPLVRFFSRYGQNERSLFGFLLSSEPYGLQEFAEQPPGAEVWYGLPEFYDYVRANFGHRLSGASYQTHWLRIAATVDTAQDLDPTEMRVLKAAAVLSLLDSPELLATDTALKACLSPVSGRNADAAITTLVDRGYLFRRGQAGGYRLWPNSSINLHAALEDAQRARGAIESASAHIGAFLEPTPVLARRHYLDTGTMRFFEVRYSSLEHLPAAAERATQADGVVLIVLVDTAADQAAALAAAEAPSLALRDNLVVGVTHPLNTLLGDVRDLLSWQWVTTNTPELAHDPYAAAEVKRQLSALSRRLEDQIGIAAALRTRAPSTVQWRRSGEPFETSAGLSSALSGICDTLFSAAPRIQNELLNRKTLSSAAAAARMRLIEGLFASADRPLFGIDVGKAPPEKSMFLSVVERGGLQTKLGDRHLLVLPSLEKDVLHLRPALDEIEAMLARGDNARVSVDEIFSRLGERPFGIRMGVIPFLLAFVLKLREHELAVYENGTFKLAFGGPDFVRMVKAPATFEIQRVSVQGVRAEVFAKLAAAFAAPAAGRDHALLDVVQPLARFGAKLPEYTRHAGALEPQTIKVRDVLTRASDPPKMLFQELPVACGMDAFTGDAPEPQRAAEFVARLEAAVVDLRGDYPRLLGRIIETISAVIGSGDGPFDRADIAQRAARVANIATQPRLKTFALRLRDTGTSDEAWAEAIGSYIVAKPPAKWRHIDEKVALDELTSLGQLFQRVETAAFEIGGFQGERDAMLVKLTQATGADRAQVIQSARLTTAAAKTASEISERLATRDRSERMQILTQLLWETLAEAGTEGETTQDGARRA